MGMKHDWEKIISLVETTADTIGNWTALARVVSGHTRSITPEGLKKGLEREMGRTFPSYSAFQAAQSAGKMSPLANALLDNLRKRGHRDLPMSLLVLSEMFDRSPASILAAAEELSGADYNIQITDDKHLLMPTTVPATCQRLPVEMWTKPDRIHRYGLLGDTHLCNRNARLDLMELVYDIYAEEGIETVLHCGNMIDGEFRYNRHELVAHGVEGQIAYAAEHYPKREGIVTRFISADEHEGWYGKEIGFDIGRHMGNQFARLGRDDLQWIGHVEIDLLLHDDNPKAILRLMHPGGGTAYAISYSPQKIVESWQGGEKPAIAAFGHYHKSGQFYPREVHTFLVGCLEDQTMFMRKKKLAAHVGAWIMEIHLSDMGSVLRVKGEFLPFYNSGYYKDWSYAGM